ncbi:MarR family winged helix-turn-helix transcriptional regulator [Tenggerimyces flavus]|uniref:MarR family winged helix-turn-helix transcriptional regulator n=1 Tax=Tenggerimyces flavus TaxID=1708749 RepID=A0ABV7YPQ5_9ACTN|nr:MarR family transcriptional regulator [Tenggerimyces flavus]MBM7789414.1 DNA-binding MarR family transcriptional regulator [Tenggerimyces flavus]
MQQTLGPATGLIRLAFRVQEVYAQVGRDHDLTTAQAQILCTLADRPHGMAELCTILGLERSSLTGLVDRAAHRGLVVRTADPNDRRAVLVTLTPEGAKAGAEFHDDLIARMDELLLDLPAPERERFARTVNRLVADVPAVFHD